MEKDLGSSTFSPEPMNNGQADIFAWPTLGAFLGLRPFEAISVLNKMTLNTLGCRLDSYTVHVLITLL